MGWAQTLATLQIGARNASRAWWHLVCMNHSVDGDPGDLIRRKWERIVLSDAANALGRWISAAGYLVETRQPRPWVAMVAVPLEINAAVTASVWWPWPLLIACIWWWADRNLPRMWLKSVEYSSIGSIWCMTLPLALAVFPTSRTIVGIVWGGAALILAVAAFSVRRAELETYGRSFSGC